MIFYNKMYTVDLRNIFQPQFEYLCYRLHDGRISGHLVEDIIPHYFLNNILVYKPATYRDWLYKEQVAIECKCLTKKGWADIAPSAMVGSGRKFNKEKFDGICSTRGYCIVDIRPENYVFPFIFIQGYRGMDHIVTSNIFGAFANQNPRSIDELHHL